MRVIVAVSLLAMANAASADELKLNPYGKVFTGDEGLKVEMATVEAKNEKGFHDALIRVTGAAAHDLGIDGQVILYRAVGDRKGVDYKTTKDGREINRMASIKSSWGDFEDYELYLGKKTIRLVYDKQLSAKLDVKELQKNLSPKK